MSEATVGLLHPGEMGAAVGQCLTAAGHRVLWAPEGRSAASAARAAAAGLTAASRGLAGLVREAGIAMRARLGRLGLLRLYVNLNSVSRSRTEDRARPQGTLGRGGH